MRPPAPIFCRYFSSEIRRLRTSGASALAASIALCRHLPPGYVFSEIDVSGRVHFAGKSQKTHVAPPSLGEIANTASLDKLGTAHERISTSIGEIHWWHLGRLERSAVRNSLEDSTAILDVIIARVASSPAERKKLIQSVNGIVGAANGTARATKADLYTILRGRFEGRPHLLQVITDRDFESFLVTKADELELRHDGTPF